MPRLDKIIMWTGGNLAAIKHFTNNRAMIENHILFIRTHTGYKRVEKNDYIKKVGYYLNVVRN